MLCKFIYKKVSASNLKGNQAIMLIRKWVCCICSLWWNFVLNYANSHIGSKTCLNGYLNDNEVLWTIVTNFSNVQISNKEHFTAICFTNLVQCLKKTTSDYSFLCAIIIVQPQEQMTRTNLDIKTTRIAIKFFILSHKILIFHLVFFVRHARKKFF